MERSGAFNWTCELQPNKTCNSHDESMMIVDDSEHTESLIRAHPVLSRISLLDNQFAAQKIPDSKTPDGKHIEETSANEV